MKKIYTAANPPDAHIVRGILETHGIACEVRGEALFSVRGELPMVGDTFPTVWIVKNTDQQKAQAVVDEFDRRIAGQGENDEYWMCSGCGERLESQFTACWQCGASRVEDAA